MSCGRREKEEAEKRFRGPRVIEKKDLQHFPRSKSSTVYISFLFIYYYLDVLLLIFE